MIKPIKLKITPEHNVFFSSDWHFNHGKEFIYGKRGFKSVEEHNNGLINKINEQARATDSIVFCGDFSLNCSLAQFKEFTARIQCQTIFMCHGNHNGPWYNFYRELITPQHGPDGEYFPYRWNNIVFMGVLFEMTVNGQGIVVHHFPLNIWNYQRHGAFHVCGHSHNSFEQTKPDYPDHKRLDVGWDVFHKLLPFNELQRIMDRKQIVKLDHH